jgi:hypothetical protein
MSDTWVNAVIGALVNVVLTPAIPLAPVLGGAAAGYLEADGRAAGLRVGALSGVLAVIPLLLLFFVLGNLLFVVAGAVVGAPPGLAELGGLVLVVGGLFALIYTVGLAALGGWLGVYVRQETGLGARYPLGD